MKEKDMFNKIIKDTPEENEQEVQTAQQDVQETVKPRQEQDAPQENKKTKPGESAKANMPPVKPSTIILMCLFAMLFAAVYFFSPYILQYLPFGGTTIQQDVGIQPVSYNYLVQNCHSVVIGKSIQTRTVVSDTNQELVYTEHLFEITEILYGQPIMEDDKHLITYSLGGTLTVSDHLGRPQKVTYKYNDSVELGNDTVLLFLDDNNNVISEKYGLFKKHSDTQYYDTSGTVYAVNDIKKALNKR